MGIKNTVFPSKSERENYYKLSRTWGTDYRIYHNLPFLHVFTTDNLVDYSFPNNPIEITDKNIALLKKTSIDFSICDSNDTPLLCIEFDGLKDGFNVGTTYHPKEPLFSPWRKIITELKLRVAHGSIFPYFVVGSKHFNDTSDQIKLTIVDGIIGEVITFIKSNDKFSEGFNPLEIGYSEDEFNNLSPDIKHDMIQDWVFMIEIEMEFENNPIIKKVSELTQKYGISSYKKERLEYPTPNFSINMKDRINQFSNALMFGSKVTLYSKIYGESVGQIWLPNFKSPGYSGFGLLDEIAKLIALENLRRNNNLD